MLRLDFKEASTIISAVDAELEDALRVVWNQAVKARRSELSFFLAKYPYKNFVFKNGQALGPDGQPLRADLLVAGQLPVGLILDNVLEVIDEVIRNGEVIEFPQSLLFKKQLIGLWELIDEQLTVEGRPTANWTISSGSRNLKFLEFPTQKVKWDRLRARYRQLSTHDKEDIRRLRETDLIGKISEVNEKCRQWATQVLYFSPSWFDELRRQLDEHETALPAMRSFSYFQTRGWSTLARVRYNDDQLTDALTEWGGDHNAPRCKAAYLLLRHSFQVLTQRRPCFGLADGSHPLGPLGVLRKELLQVAHLNETILGPMYLHQGQVGFLSLSQLVPSAFEQNPEDNLENIFKIISRSRDAASRLGHVIPGLDNVPELFSRLTFRVKTGRQRQKGRHGSVATFKLHCTPGGGTFQRRSVPVEAFYEPVFSGAGLPTPDSRFFRVAIKLDMRESTNIPEY